MVRRDTRTMARQERGPQIDTGGLANDANSTILDETATFTMAGLSVTGNTTLGDAASDTVTSRRTLRLI